MDPQPGKEVFANLMQQHKAMLFKVCNSYCTNKSDIDDLAQEMIYQLWRSYPSYKPEYSFTTWMYRILLNVAISFYRQKKRSKNTIPLEEHLIDIADVVGQETDTDRNIRLLQQFINELKELDKALMILYLEERSHKEMAEIMGISETNVATKISRIKEKLKLNFLQVNK